MAKITLKEIDDIIKRCSIELSDFDYCGEKESLADEWNNPDYETLDEVMENHFVEDYYVDPNYNNNRPDLDSLNIVMESGNSADVDGDSTDYFVVKVLTKDNKVVAAYYNCD